MNKTTEVAIEKETKDIMNQIVSINKSIDHSKYMVGGLKDKEHSWLAKLTGKAKDEKIADLAVALGSTNVAVADLSKVVQKAMILSQHSMIHSQTMADTIGKMLSEGLQDANGRIVQLSDQDREIAKYILKSAESFTKNQKEIATEFSKTSNQVDTLEGRIGSMERQQHTFISEQQEKTKTLQESLDKKVSRFEEKFKSEVADVIEKLEDKISREVEQCESLITNHKGELEKQRVEGKQQLDNFTQQLENKVEKSIKEIETQVAGGVNQCENLINNFKGELNSQRDNLESIVADAGKALRQETEHLLLQQKAELEELKSQLQANKKTPPLAIAALAVAIAALLGVVVAFCTLKPNTEAPVSAPTAAAELESTTTAPTN